VAGAVKRFSAVYTKVFKAYADARPKTVRIGVSGAACPVVGECEEMS
jgi:hypothetical protein